jgi:bile acid-coenzyme A ligase
VEAALSAHPDVVTSVVVGLPDDDLGQRVHAVIEATAVIPDEDLRAFLAERLAR